MEKSAYIERIYRELTQYPVREDSAQDSYLLDIFEHIKDLPSPEKEDTLVYMLATWHLRDQSPEAPQAAA